MYRYVNNEKLVTNWCQKVPAFGLLLCFSLHRLASKGDKEEKTAGPLFISFTE